MSKPVIFNVAVEIVHEGLFDLDALRTKGWGDINDDGVILLGDMYDMFITNHKEHDSSVAYIESPYIEEDGDLRDMVRVMAATLLDELNK